MDVQRIKDYIYENELIEDVLTNLNCHHIKKHDGFFTAANPDGDNQSAIVVYENENLVTINYTRQLVKQHRSTDLFDLIAFFEECTFPEALKWVCNTLGLDYYSEPTDRPESLQILELLRRMASDDNYEEEKPLKPISENILSYYLPYGNSMFEDDNISLDVQEEFGIGYDCCSNRVTIPIRDELGSLCGVKGRFFGNSDDYNPKYLYIEKCAKSRILYGYHENQAYIKNSNHVFVVESEKSVLQLATAGIRNCIATGGKTISKHQITMLTRMNVTLVFAFDKDVTMGELQDIANMFMDGIPVYALYDTSNILGEKMSPTDDMDVFYALKQNIIQLR